jgi:acyl-CoA synthetase (NDP forming)
MENPLAKFGIKAAPSSLESDLAGCKAAAKKIGYPVALKLVSQQIMHKTDAGAVKLGIRNEYELSAAHKELCRIGRGLRSDGFLVQKMARNGIELIVGGKRDSQFGQLILLGVGGIYVEVLRDVTFRVCPITKKDAHEMMEELRSYSILSGSRGSKPINKEKLASLLVKVSKFLLSENPAELDLNPVIADHRGYDIVDVRLIK